MPEAAYSRADLELFGDLERAASAAGVNTCLIGAGAIKMGADLAWGVRLGRRTLDWDFAVRVSSWAEFRELLGHLVAPEGGFERAAEPHRFRHVSGGTLDVVPYGELEDPPGTIQWEDGTRMVTAGLGVLDRHHENHLLENQRVRVASLPALLGLKLLAYRDRREQTPRDVQDAFGLLLDAESFMDDDRVTQGAVHRLGTGDVGYGEVGAYLVGRDVGCIFDDGVRAGLLVLLAEIVSPEVRLVSDAQRSERGSILSRSLIAARFEAFRLGVEDR